MLNCLVLCHHPVSHPSIFVPNYNELLRIRNNSLDILVIRGCIRTLSYHKYNNWLKLVVWSILFLTSDCLWFKLHLKSSMKKWRSFCRSKHRSVCGICTALAAKFLLAVNCSNLLRKIMILVACTFYCTIYLYFFFSV